MATTDESSLESWYESSIGEPSTADEVYGYWLFALGILAGFVGIALVVASNSAGDTIRGAGIGVAALGLLVALVGQIVRLPLKRMATTLSIVGALVSTVAVAWFGVAFNAGNWGSAFAHSESLIIGLYGVGILVMAAGSIITPLVTGPREREAAAEARASEARAERDEARESVARHEEKDQRQAMAVSESETEQTAAEARAGEAEAERDAAMAEITRLGAENDEQAAAVAEARERADEQPDSQSTFELFTDTAGEYRWRLRHDNGNIIADGSEGYASRQSAIQGLDAVRRDAIGATMVELDESDDDTDQSESGADQSDDTETTDEPLSSQSQFELYTDTAGEYRWRLRHDNGNIIADGSEGYTTRQSAMQGLDAVKRDVAAATVLELDKMDGDERPEDTTDGQSRIELYTDTADEYRWRLRHDNDNIIADSAEGYSSRQKAMQGINAVQRDAVGATVLDLDERDSDGQ